MERARAVLIAIQGGGDPSRVLMEAMEGRDERLIAGLGEFIRSALQGVVLDPEHL